MNRQYTDKDHERFNRSLREARYVARSRMADMPTSTEANLRRLAKMELLELKKQEG